LRQASPEAAADSDLDYEEEEDEVHSKGEDIQSEPEESNDVEDDTEEVPESEKEVSPVVFLVLNSVVLFLLTKPLITLSLHSIPRNQREHNC
jgi:hypothetical protein